MTESCGKCIPCRAGTVQMYELLGRFSEHRAAAGGLGDARTLCDLVRNTSLCGLGQSAPNPVMSTLRYFRPEYEAALSADCPRALGRMQHEPSATLRSAMAKLSHAPPIGQTIFDAAWDSGIHIPRLCHLGGLSDVGACRLCLVEIEGPEETAAVVHSPKWPKTWWCGPNTPQLREYRKLIVELLFAERNHVCSVCVLNGACELQSVAADLGVDHIRFSPQYPQLGGGRQPRTLRPGSQPLHSLHALRSRLRRNRGRAHLGRDRPRRRMPGGFRHGASPGANPKPAPVAESACKCVPPARCS